MDIAELLGEILKNLQLTIATAESCTGGGVASAITSVSGSSAYFVGGIVAYTADIKERLLGVERDTIAKYDIVSREVAIEMARGAQEKLGVDCAISTTGVAALMVELLINRWGQFG